MPFFTSLKGVRAKKIFLAFFSLSSLFPILIAIYIVDEHIIPFIGDKGYERLNDVFYIGLSTMLFFPLLSFFLMYRWLHVLESVTSEIMSKSTAVANREEEFGMQKIEASAEFGNGAPV